MSDVVMSTFQENFAVLSLYFSLSDISIVFSFGAVASSVFDVKLLLSMSGRTFSASHLQ